MAAKMNCDFIIIGSGAGGCAAAYKLAKAGKQVLVIEKGKALPKDGSTQDYVKVIQQGDFKSKEEWLDSKGKAFMPEEYFNLGGKTKWYGAALLRFDPSEFNAELDFQCLGWPIDYRELEPYYDEAEQLLAVKPFSVEADLKALAAKLERQGSAWQAKPLPLALSQQILQDDHEARHFDGFASTHGLKADGEIAFLDRVAALAYVKIMAGQVVEHLLGGSEPGNLAGVMLANGQCVTADTIILAAGALHSPRLLEDYLNRSGLVNALPNAKLVGRYFKRHILTAMLAFSASKKTDKLRKTMLWANPKFPHSSVQPLGFGADVLGALFPKYVPKRITLWLSQYAYGFFLQTEDGSHSANKVSAAAESDNKHQPRLDYEVKRIAKAQQEHRRMVSNFRRTLWRAGFVSFTKSIGLEGTAHACGTLVTGNDPITSVVDGNGKVHGFSNLYVADGSILPRSSKVNPALTIYAWALRLADTLINDNKETL